MPEHGCRAVESARVATPRSFRAVPLAFDCADFGEWGGRRNAHNFVHYYVRDGIPLEVQWLTDGRRCWAAPRSITTVITLGCSVSVGPDDKPLLSARKILDWDTCLDGWVTSLPDDCMAASLIQIPCWGATWRRGRVHGGRRR